MLRREEDRADKATAQEVVPCGYEDGCEDDEAALHCVGWLEPKGQPCYGTSCSLVAFWSKRWT